MRRTTMIQDLQDNAVWQRVQTLHHRVRTQAGGLKRRAAFGIAALAMSSSVWAAGPLTTNTSSFRIPFAVDGTDGSALSGTAILFASRDGGPFEQLQRVSADQKGFQFSAPTDGHYAFAVRVTDADGNVAGNAPPLSPELEVVVDTAPPILQLQLVEKEAGEVSVSWSCSESSIAPGSLRLEYAEGSDGRWMPLSAVAQANGQTSLQTRPGSSISVRGFVADLAGNQGGGSGQIVLTTAGQYRNSPQSPAASVGRDTNRRPAGTQNSPSASLPAPAQSHGGSQAMGASPFPAFGQNSSAAGTTPTRQSDSGTAASGQLTATSSRSLPGPRTPAPNGTGFGIPETAQSAPLQIGGQTSGRPVLPPTPTYQHQNQPGPPAGYPALPALAASHAPASANGRTAAGFPTFTSSTPPDQEGQIVNNRVFDIAYEVQDVGPSGVSAVQLFVTENNGQEWFRYGDDADLRSPFQVDTRGEGTFGFEVRVLNGLGFCDPPPQPGDLPSIVVTVDQTPPVAELAPPKVVATGQGHIRLDWRVSDSNSSHTPVRLEQAISTSGPWTPVLDWQADRQNLELPIQPGTPNAVYFRLLARDAAGNIATTQTPHPVLIDQQRPTAKLLSIQAVSNTRGF